MNTHTSKEQSVYYPTSQSVYYPTFRNKDTLLKVLFFKSCKCFCEQLCTEAALPVPFSLVLGLLGRS